jgi:hypothetical protein
MGSKAINPVLRYATGHQCPKGLGYCRMFYSDFLTGIGYGNYFQVHLLFIGIYVQVLILLQPDGQGRALSLLNSEYSTDVKFENSTVFSG